MKTPLVITDLDGTLVNVLDEVLADLAMNYPDVALSPEDIKQYDIAESLYPALANHFNDRNELAGYLEETFSSEDGAAMFEEARPYWRLHQLYRSTLQQGAIELVACTSRYASDRIQEATESWLGNWGYDGVECLFATDKVAAISDVIRPDDDRDVWFVEDNVETARVVKKAYPDMRVFLVERPWTKCLIDTERDFDFGVETALEALCPPTLPLLSRRR